MKAKSPLSSRFSHLATAGLVAGSLLAAKPAHAQGVVLQYGGTVSELYGTGNGVPNGAVVSGTINYNPLQLLWNSSAEAFIDPTATETETINGVTTTFTGLEALDVVNTVDTRGNPADLLGLFWGPNYNDGVGTTEPAGTISGGNTVANIQTLVNLGLTKAVSYGANDYLDTGFTVGSDASGVNYASGPLSTFQVEATPEPGTWALGGLGAAALAAAKLRSRIKQTHARKPVGLNVGM